MYPIDAGESAVDDCLRHSASFFCSTLERRDLRGRCARFEEVENEDNGGIRILNEIRGGSGGGVGVNEERVDPVDGELSLVSDSSASSISIV